MNSRYFSGCSILATAVAVACPAQAQDRAFDIPSQPLQVAIATLGKQARLQIVAPGEGLENIRSRPVKGMMDARVALRQLLAGTGLEVAADDGARIVLRRAAVVQPGKPLAQAPVADDNIVVTGFRASMNIAREIKRNSDSIVDSVAAEDIGQLPDNSATEALARLPGVQIFRNRGEVSTAEQKSARRRRKTRPSCYMPGGVA